MLNKVERLCDLILTLYRKQDPIVKFFTKMKYLEFTFAITPFSEDAADALSGVLAEEGFESFVTTETGLVAYIQEPLYRGEEVQQALVAFPLDCTLMVEIQPVEEQNWNEEWEKNYFQPIVVDGQCVIRSSFHTNIPAVPFDILIDPKMAFGTGHHETTYLMLCEVLKADVVGKSVLDMGCGTAVLAILAAKRGATDLVAIDIDEWATENSLENIRLNNQPSINIKTGGAELLGDRQYDIVLANINRNILLADMHAYVGDMVKGGSIYFSGFYTEDLPMIRQEAVRNGLTFVGHTEKNNWVAAHFVK